MLPCPEEAKNTRPGSAFASATSSRRFFTGSEGCTTTMYGPLEIWITGVMSAIGSKRSL
jgi:hypothetical protein